VSGNEIRDRESLEGVLLRDRDRNAVVELLGKLKRVVFSIKEGRANLLIVDEKKQKKKGRRDSRPPTFS